MPMESLGFSKDSILIPNDFQWILNILEDSLGFPKDFLWIRTKNFKKKALGVIRISWEFLRISYEFFMNSKGFPRDSS